MGLVGCLIKMARKSSKKGAGGKKKRRRKKLKLTLRSKKVKGEQSYFDRPCLLMPNPVVIEKNQRAIGPYESYQ